MMDQIRDARREIHAEKKNADLKKSTESGVYYKQEQNDAIS